MNTITQRFGTARVIRSLNMALLAYQLSLRTPEPPAGSFIRGAAKRGERLFHDEGGCAACHQSPNFTDVLSGPDLTTLQKADLVELLKSL